MSLEHLLEGSGSQICLIRAGDGHFVIDRTNGEQIQVSGSLPSETQNVINELAIPCVNLDSGHPAVRAALENEVPTPSVKPDFGPYHSLSRIPIELYANLMHQLGFDVSNMPTLKLPSSLFSPDDRKDPDSVLCAVRTVDIPGMPQTSKDRLVLPDPWVSTDCRTLINYGKYILNSVEQAERHCVEMRHRGLPECDVKDYLEAGARLIALESTYSAIAYETQLLAAGNFTPSVSWQRLAHASQALCQAYQPPQDADLDRTTRLLWQYQADQFAELSKMTGQMAQRAQNTLDPGEPQPSP